MLDKMAHGIRRFEIQLNKSSAIYAPGEIIKCRILINLYKPKCIKALRVLVKGICRVNDNDTNSRGPSDSVIAEETYFNTDILICGGNDEMTLPIGESQFLFNYELPENAPSSFSHKFGSIRYTMKAIMDRPWKFNHEADTFFRIEAPLKLETLTLTPLDDTDAKNVSKFLPCFTNGYVRFRFRLPQNGFNCHEKIPLKINYMNKSRTVDVKKMTCSLIQTITFHNRPPFHNKRTEKNVIETVTQTGAFPKEYEGVMELKVPDIPVSFLRNCKFIDIDYQLCVTVSLNGCNFKLKKIYDVIIGSSTREFFDSEIFFAQNGNVVNASANSSSQTITYNRKPDVVDNTYVTESPPSYDSVVSDPHRVDHDYYAGSQNHDVDGAHHYVDSGAHHHADSSAHDHADSGAHHHADSGNHHIYGGNHYHTDSSNHHHADSSNSCHDGGYSGGYDGGNDGGYDGGCDGGYDGGYDGGD